MPVIVMRNPFARLMSYFCRSRLQNALQDERSLASFPSWVEALRIAHNAGAHDVPLHQGEPVTVELHGQSVVFSIQDLYHTLPASEMLRKLFSDSLTADLNKVLSSCAPAECWFLRHIFIMHIETIPHDLNLMKVRLCLWHRYCEPLPWQDVHLNSNSLSRETYFRHEDTIRLFWLSDLGKHTAQLVTTMYATDFKLGSYPNDPREQSPWLPSDEELDPFLRKLAAFAAGADDANQPWQNLSDNVDAGGVRHTFSSAL